MNTATYRRPFVDRYLGRCPRGRAPRYPLPLRMLRERDVFDLFVLDGGAFFFTNEHLGGTGTGRFVSALESGEMLAPWTGRRRRAPAAGDVDWFAAYDPEKGPWAPGQRIEQHVWLHRLYFLLPLAQDHLRTGRTRPARRWYEFFLAWRKRFPAMGDPPPAPRPKATAFIWHDMQVTWRLLVFLHSVFLLGSRGAGRALAPQEWVEVYRAIAVHARWLFTEVGHELAADRRGRPALGNHLLQKGVALVCAGVLFPEMDNAAAWVEAGRRVVRAHLLHDIRRDGGSVEASPSYSHFIAGLHLLAHLALSANGRPPIPGLAAGIRRQYSFLEGTMSPSGRSLQVGDSYSLDAREDLSLARHLFPLPAAARPRSRCYSASRFAVLRSARATVFVDAMDVRCGHVHPAKPNVLVYGGRVPVAVDCGCVNYDRPDYRGHFGSWAAHNVAAPVPFMEDPGRWRGISLTLAGWKAGPDGGEARFVCRHAGGDTPFVWRRTVRLDGNRIEVLDRVACARRETVALSWHFAAHAGVSVAVSGAGRRLRAREAAHAAVDESNREYAARALTWRQTGRRVDFRTVLVV